MNPSEPALFVHDTRVIIDANERACQMFGVELWELVDQALTNSVPHEDMKWLVELRMKTIRERGDLGPQRLPFMRADGSVFWAECQTRKRDDGLFETEVKYISEY